MVAGHMNLDAFCGKSCVISLVRRNFVMFGVNFSKNKNVHDFLRTLSHKRVNAENVIDDDCFWRLRKSDFILFTDTNKHINFKTFQLTHLIADVFNEN